MVTVNGERVTDLAFRVDPDSDEVAVCGKVLDYRRKNTVLMLNKPAGVITSVSDELGRRTVIDIARESGYTRRLFPVGRLDKDTTGMLLLTDDGELTNRMTHPRYHVEKVYRVRTVRKVTGRTVELLASGVDIGEYVTEPCRVRLVREIDNGSELEISLKEGKKRQIRRMLESCGHRVISLHRKSIGGLEFGDLSEGELRVLSKKEEKFLREKVGLD
jgi:23S rRNA pseudouridine2605 synthase